MRKKWWGGENMGLLTMQRIPGQYMLTKSLTWQTSLDFIAQNSTFDFSYLERFLIHLCLSSLLHGFQVFERIIFISFSCILQIHLWYASMYLFACVIDSKSRLAIHHGFVWRWNGRAETHIFSRHRESSQIVRRRVAESRKSCMRKSSWASTIPEHLRWLCWQLRQCDTTNRCRTFTVQVCKHNFCSGELNLQFFIFFVTERDG